MLAFLLASKSVFVFLSGITIKTSTALGKGHLSQSYPNVKHFNPVYPVMNMNKEAVVGMMNGDMII